MIDKRHNYGIMLDTETTTDTAEEGKGFDFPLVFDIGWQVIDSTGEKYLERSYIVKEIYTRPDLMTHFFAINKLPQYAEDIENGKRIILPFQYIKQIFNHDYSTFNCKFVVAHNLKFDDRALKNTILYITEGRYKYFLPFGTEKWDTMTMCTDILKHYKTYQIFCENNNFMTNHKTPRPQLKAEIVYRYIIKDVTFEESHTGLEDVEIERQIFKFCVKSHKKMRRNAYRTDEEKINKPSPFQTR